MIDAQGFHIPWTIILYTLSLTILLLIIIYRYMRARLLENNLPLKPFDLVFTFYLVFLVLIGFLTKSNWFWNFTGFLPVPAQPLIFIFLLFFISVFHPQSYKYFKTIKLKDTIEFQTFRLFAELLIFLLVIDDLLPSIMTIAGRNYDIVVAASAPFVSTYVLQKDYFSKANKKKILIFWNVLGFIILANTVVTAVLSMPTPMQVFFTEPMLVVPALFPVYLLPYFLVLIALTLHLVSIKKLLKNDFNN